MPNVITAFPQRQYGLAAAVEWWASMFRNLRFGVARTEDTARISEFDELQVVKQRLWHDFGIPEIRPSDVDSEAFIQGIPK